jgi:uncharacterized protein with HEPN domain
MNPQRGDAARLHDIRDAIDAVDRHPVTERADFDADELLRFFVLKHIEIIGEAVFKLSDDLKSRHAQVPWHKIEKARHILVHDYFDVNWDIVWSIREHHLPSLKSLIDEVIAAEES